MGDGLPRRQPRAEPEDGLYTEKEYEETMASIRARFPTMNFDTIDPRFMHPFTAIIAGPSSSGKSVICMRLIRKARECIAPPPERIVYCYSVYQPIFDQYPNVEFVERLPDLNMLTESNAPCSSLMTSCTKPTKRSQSYLLEYPTTQERFCRVLDPELIQQQ